jgi:hypothetical protein
LRLLAAARALRKICKEIRKSSIFATNSLPNGAAPSLHGEDHHPSM